MTDEITPTDLTEALQGPDREQVASGIREQFARLSERIAQDMTKGLSPKDFEAQKKISQAVKCSTRIFEKYMKT
ncbi:hypothetical protein GCM10011385_18590 [Nitratireductor aestuarii]|uniref:Uncharacterized protein n=1 Tax=Nitratireductor aestuarii TaxID=1735103 RepID=A0A916W4K2_9HYPH|nr:hypothetical protein [Nitratireductor aestuarii]GGA65065.1 hypothetical protein GCM10011385_18590 [Nitratireductor aestuarii]